MKFGVAYYPEQWPEEQWGADAQMMVEMGIEVVRVGEFAWWRLEPRRERIDTNWLEDAVEVLSERGLRVLLATPTAAPPPWLFNRHPNILPLQADGSRWYLGSKKHVCINNPAYNKYARRIVSELARTFRDEDIWAWQVDNEPGAGPASMCYCEECEKAFRRWLKRRYGRIDRLNRIWGTSTWSQGYHDWHEIPAPRRTVFEPHPSLSLDYSRFMSAQYRNFVEEQRDIISSYVGDKARVTVSEPSGADVQHVDVFSLAKQQDVVSLDNFPTDSSRLEETALGLDLARSLKHTGFWITQQQAGATLIPGHTQQPRPGQLRLWTLQAAARGAEFISYSRWRTAQTGQEMHSYGLFDSDGTPRRRLDEIKGVIEEMQDSDLFAGWEPRTDAAILIDHESAWSFESTPFGWDGDYWESVQGAYRELRREGISVEFLEHEENLSPYELIVAPMQFITSPAMAKRLKVFVHDGGTLVITAPAGYKTPQGRAIESPPPGPLMELLGVEVVEYDALGDHTEAFWSPLDASSETFEADGLCSVIQLRGADAIAEYADQYYADTPAVTLAREGRGQALFSGVALDAEGWEWLMDEAITRAELGRCAWAQDEVEVIPLTAVEGEGERICVLNHSDESVELPLPSGREVVDLLDKGTFNDSLTLPPYDAVILNGPA